MEVPPVDERDLQVAAAEMPHGLGAAEAAADHHHPVRRHDPAFYRMRAPAERPRA